MSRAARLRSVVFVCAASALTVACWQSPDEGEPPGSVCDPTLSYEENIAPIVERYCSRCHASTVALSQRHGAPGDQNFDSEEALLEHALSIQLHAGVGPYAENRSMPPPGFRAPSDEERAELSRFLECELESGAPAAPPHHH